MTKQVEALLVPLILYLPRNDTANRQVSDHKAVYVFLGCGTFSSFALVDLHVYLFFRVLGLVCHVRRRHANNHSS